VWIARHWYCDRRCGGLFFFQGTLRIPLHRFFSATSVILMVVAFQLALTGVHELSEAMWIWSARWRCHDRQSCATSCSSLCDFRRGGTRVLREWFSGKRPAEDASLNPAERRMREWEFRASAVSFARQFSAFSWCYRWRRSLSTAAHECSGAGADARGAEHQCAFPWATCRIRASISIRRTSIARDPLPVIHRGNGDYATALDACQICGTAVPQEGRT